MPRGINYHLHFSVGELSCQLLRISSAFLPRESDPSNYFPHSHPFLEIHYLPSGSCTYHAVDTDFELGSGQLLLIPPSVRHMLSRRHQPLELITLCILVQPPPDRATAPSCNLYSALHAVPTLLAVPSGSPLDEALSHIRSLFLKESPGFFVVESLRAYSALLLATLSDQLAPAHSTAPARPTPPQSFLIDQFFCNRDAMSGGAQVLAERLNVSPRHLDRILLEVCGMNFRQKLNQSKLSYATALLINRSLSIDEIAHMLGYSSSTAFGAFIKKFSGMTPSQLRQSLLVPQPNKISD